MSLPSVSVIFLSYNQQAYVREALRSILTQDLPDYEVVIGDDASRDDTRRIIEEEIAAYRGRARIVLLPPAPNLGIIRNFNRCVAVSSGEILVAAAGDDVSHPHRLRRVAEFFRAHPGCYAHYSNARVVDAAGGVLRPTWYHHDGIVTGEFNPASFHLYQGVQFCGATASYRAEVHRRFPPMYGVIGGEDGPSIIRSLLLGSAAVDSEVLLDWRWHGANVSHGGKPKGLDWRAKLRRSAAWPAGQKVHRRGYLSDIAFALREGLVTQDKAARFRQLTDDLHAKASVKFHCTHPNARWKAIGGAVRRFWQVSPRGFAWKVRFLAKALAKKLLPGPLRAVVLFDFSKF
jgi:glycosyltransferase involved in cell wall biosynthesis